MLRLAWIYRNKLYKMYYSQFILYETYSNEQFIFTFVQQQLYLDINRLKSVYGHWIRASPPHFKGLRQTVRQSNSVPWHPDNPDCPMTLRQKKTDWKGLNIIDELNTYQKQIDSKVMEKRFSRQFKGRTSAEYLTTDWVGYFMVQ